MDEQRRPAVPDPFSTGDRAAIPYRRPPATGETGRPPDGPPGHRIVGRAGPPRPPARPAAAGRSHTRTVTLVALAVLTAAAAGTVVATGAGRESSAPSPTGLASPAGVPPPAASPSPPPSPSATRPPIASPTRAPATSPTRRSAPPPAGRTPRPRAPRQLAVSLRIRGDADSLRLRAADLGPTLLRVVRVDDGTARARRADDGRSATLDLVPDRGSVDEVEVLLDSSVRWSLRTDGDVDETDIDMSAGEVSRIDLRGGPRVRLRLPGPVGTTSVRISGDVARCEVRTPRSVPARIGLRRAAGRVVVDGRAQDAGRDGATLSVGTPGGRDGIDFRADEAASLTWNRS